MRKLVFPFARHLGRFHLFVHQLNDFATAGGAHQVVLLRLDKSAFLESLDDTRLCCRRSEPAVLHGFGEFFVLNLLSRGLHRGKERGFGVVLGLALLFLLQFDAVERGVVADIPFGETFDQVRDFVAVALAFGCSVLIVGR